MTEPERVTPERCALLVAIPLGRASFERDLARPFGFIAGLADQFGWARDGGLRAWHEYHRTVVSVVEVALESVRRLGTFVKVDPSVADLTRATAAFSVVTLLAHHDLEGGGVEIDDAFLDTEALSDAIDPGFTGVFDLCTCRSDHFVNGIKHRRPNCLVAWVDADTDVRFRVILYQKIMHLLKRHPGRYTDAVFDLRAALSKLARAPEPAGPRSPPS